MKQFLLAIAFGALIILVFAMPQSVAPVTQIVPQEVTREVTTVPDGNDSLVATLRSVIQTEMAICCGDATDCMLPTPSPTRHYPTLTPTPTQKITETVRPSNTPVPTPTAPVCIWICHKPNSPAEQDYCCESKQCVEGHLYGGHYDPNDPDHNDYLGKCREKARLFKIR